MTEKKSKHMVQRDFNNLYACLLVFVVDLNSKSHLYLPW